MPDKSTIMSEIIFIKSELNKLSTIIDNYKSNLKFLESQVKETKKINYYSGDPFLKDLLRLFCTHYKCHKSSIVGESRLKDDVTLRYSFIKICRMLNIAYKRIGLFLNRDHATILNLYTKSWRQYDNIINHKVMYFYNMSVNSLSLIDSEKAINKSIQRNKNKRISHGRV